MTPANDAPWLFCQLGAREHYILPRGFHRRGRLRALITEAWAPPGGIAARAPGALGRKFADRFSADLADAAVEDFTAATIAFELAGRVRRRAPAGWPAIMLRNAWFEKRVVARMRDKHLLADRPTVFAYSYAALEILRAAREAGCRTVLGQIDPAITEENIVADAVSRHARLHPDWERAPAAYWTRWRAECALADHIVVNSPWARDGLEVAGIDAGKLAVVPLAYDAPGARAPRQYPARFDDVRPLRVLFLGSLVIRKGIAELLEAAASLAAAPVEFHLVGGAGIVFPPEVLANPKIVRHGAVSRGAAAAHYAAADLFILPSLSDGFGLTQIEASSHRLPVIASRHCGDVVRDGVDGLLLPEISAAAITVAIGRYLESPEMLGEHARATEGAGRRFAPDTVVGQLIEAMA
ncbi:MAG: glycosyltransferase family 4 protein [Sphingomonas sp.]|uniref:glycosyltransferase family 4 protein n=1 Tax=Sphingomonas sp. TaxID=28214 RepID=UPI003562FCD2